MEVSGTFRLLLIREYLSKKPLLKTLFFGRDWLWKIWQGTQLWGKMRHHGNLVDKGKRKLGEVPADLWDSVEDFGGMSSLWDVANVMRSGRVFQSANLQVGSSSNRPV